MMSERKWPTAPLVEAKFVYYDDEPDMVRGECWFFRDDTDPQRYYSGYMGSVEAEAGYFINLTEYWPGTGLEVAQLEARTTEVKQLHEAGRKRNEQLREYKRRAKQVKESNRDAYQKGLADGRRRPRVHAHIYRLAMWAVHLPWTSVVYDGPRPVVTRSHATHAHAVESVNQTIKENQK